ncbi:hypothetical protein VL15_12225 [Burkholderia cepacia]|uniref:Uncharacterized protein n=1 Tax=Burkholderia cepacia TaxID=292 RepID=A0A0J5X3P1_BURCE|nr:hypothetical protein [Burkholderia cepacia]KML58688.1 hypothetical protein VL15_12225 [Burkholderia cepacia]
MATNQEHDEMTARYLAAMEKESRERLAKAADLISNFTALAASKGVILGSESYEYIQTIGIVAKAPGIARMLLGPIKTERDGLLSFDEIASRLPPSPHSEGCFAGPDFILMADPCYRRGMHPVNNWAPRFIDLFWQFDGLGIEKFIALDDDRVRIDVDRLGYFEFDTWYGAPFDEDIRKVKLGIAKLSPPMDIEPRHVSFLFANMYCLDIKWSESDGLKSFQALEMKTEDVQIEIGGQRYFPARYLHAEFDLVANCFRHFDGAIQLFTEDEYFQRRDSDFNMTLKNLAHIKARSRKVFKINGPLKTGKWVEFCCHFFTKNPLIFEYFSGEYPKHVTEALERIRNHTSQRAREA